MPFDRLVNAVDAWAGRRGRRDVFAQIGSTSMTPTHVDWVRSLRPEEFRAKVQQARVVVGHAGMGTIISSLQAGKPVIVMPRRGALRETRNDHQVATARYWGEHPSVHAAGDADELGWHLDRVEELHAQPKIASGAPREMISALQAFIADGRPLAA